MIIERQTGGPIDIDLVPVFRFKPEQLEFYKNVWQNINHPNWAQKHQKGRRNKINEALKKPFFLVPKPSDIASQWRLDFHDTEIEIIKDMGVAKPVIKFLKLFRDSNPPLKPIVSYWLKTIVMDMVRTYPDDDWRQGEEAEYFLKSLHHLLEKLKQQNIDYFFDRTSNMLASKLKPATIIDMKNYLEKAITGLEKSANTPECKIIWLEYFNLNYSDC